MTDDDLSPSAALEELDQADDLVLALYERDLDGLPATLRRALDRALDDTATIEGDQP